MKRAFVFFVIVSIAAAAFAQQADKSEAVRAKLQTQTVTLSFSDTDIVGVLSFLQDITGLNIVIDPECDADIAVTLRARNITIGAALKLIFEPRKLDYIIKKDGTIFVSTEKRIAQLKAGKQEPKDIGLEPEQLLFLMRDSSKIKGKVKVKKWNLKTAYGLLSIPTNEIRKIALKYEAGEDGKAVVEDPDSVETIRFTVTGDLEIDKLEVETAHGKLTLSKNDIKEILFPRPAITKSFEVQPDPLLEWLDTGIKLEKGDMLNITASGTIGEEFTPDGTEATLVARIGKNGEAFKVGTAYTARVGQEGNLYLLIQYTKLSLEEAGSSYKVKVKVEK